MIIHIGAEHISQDGATHSPSHTADLIFLIFGGWNLFMLQTEIWIQFCWQLDWGGVMDPIVEVVALLLGFIGWVMVGVALPNRYWRTSTVDGNVITTSTIYENLWMSCATDSTGVHNCREFPSLLALSGRVVPLAGYHLSHSDPPVNPRFTSFLGRLRPGVSGLDDHVDSVRHLWTAGRSDRAAVLQGWGGKLCSQREDRWHGGSPLHASR